MGVRGWGLRGKGDGVGGGDGGGPGCGGAESPLSEFSQQPPLTAAFNSAEFPEARGTPEGQTPGLGTAEGHGGFELREETPGIGG